MIIYKITNQLNGKIYIGQTQKKLEERIQGHKHGKILIDIEIKKYGIENFSYEVVEECQTVDELNNREKFWIEKLNCKYPNGYNVDDGGGGFTCSRFKDELNFYSSKVKFVGTKKFIDAETGEIHTMNVVSIEERDCNFHKLWLRHIIDSFDLIGNQKTRLCFWIIENLDRENKLVYTYSQIAEKTGISLFTVKQTMKILLDSNFLTKRNAGCYVVNPNVIFKGGRTDRLNVLFQYNKTRKSAEKPKVAYDEIPDFQEDAAVQA